MSGRSKGHGKLCVFLDRIFERKQISFWIPMVIAVLIYFLFLIFGENADKNDLIVRAPLFAALWFAGVFLVLGLQLFNPFCSAKLMDYVEIVMVIYAVWSSMDCILSFLLNVQSGFTQSSLAGIITWSAVSIVHNFRR